ncbi:DUF1573 domain-containing protein [Flavilitoribacter nigricans]|uniref:Secretion system C-terminal sorting domain-containing protein n=1 Tax=Flavilitoribacter nigricans (strain ATCC 23147 / DSM 23189 / NBRC 102662 / NCIMB 1420 / SS-2) TaxID=1122177 RepID=A0A2D0N3K5_FLAN2|nr:DUF1573 domain-containing protein [Flavilitoribacter nigricans]PHN03101.1 hypothetical protein CRP01_28905 [Flavilitoribacter nigricans DSM 23189 = NBRC 102662]
MQSLTRSFSWLITAVLLCFAFVLPAQDMPSIDRFPRPSGPVTKMEFEETTYDFGTVAEGTKVSQIFTFTNTGDEPLVLSDAKGSCGCTVPQWPIEPIMPGESASITVEFNSKGKMGKRMQRITITANTEPPQTFLALTGEVEVQPGADLSIHESTPAESELSPDCFAIFPNPTSEILKLKMEESSLGKPATISIFSKSGQLMARRIIEAIDGTLEFNVAHYPAGTYMANVQIGTGKPETRCFVVVN